jgi:hypothetical protein
MMPGFPRPQVPIISPETTFDLIHVGKCGGATVSQELRAAGYDFEQIHLRRPCASPGKLYVVLARDPVARFVSAFNWRKHLYRSAILPRNPCTDGVSSLRHRAEKELLHHFEDANTLAEELGASGPYEASAHAVLMGLIGHVTQGFHWYLGRLLEEIQPSQIAGVICTERLADDFERLFGFRPSIALNRPPGTSSTFVSASGRVNLVREFHFEYATLTRLAHMATAAGIPMSMLYDPGSGAVPNQAPG